MREFFHRKSEEKMKVKIDRSKLLGFRIDVSRAGKPAEVKKAGAKIGGKPGSKLGVKIGQKTKG
jgi:hypothetical protein